MPSKERHDKRGMTGLVFCLSPYFSVALLGGFLRYVGADEDNLDFHALAQ